MGLFPTPITRCNELETQFDLSALHIKRDDLSGEVYGGNKVRKLEFLLGKALQDGVKEVLTFGFTGSNHALATAIYAQKVGLRSISMFLPQPNSRSLRRNLLLGYHSGAELHEYSNRRALTVGTVYQSVRHWARTGRKPMIVPPGGSSPLGIVGIVNAAFELADQVKAGAMTEPDLIYVAVGSMGTAVGLRIGLEAAGLRSEVVPIRVIDNSLANPSRMRTLAHDSVAYLRACDPSFPTCERALSEYTLREEFFGTQYALHTEEGMEAIRLLREAEGIGLDGTYSGKAFAALVDDAKKGMCSGKTVLFWDTFNSRDPWSALGELDHANLPRRFHRYFKEPVQPLDAT
ncbi:MAG: pyridoxal-phosphate dependent enzyme [Candidatus Hydrogenedentes bacterium]|nr:pyridoxal-phosphate dependent enzyme [Candidatus Hydrogenedentota bacterium]